ncbi:hypothetical protein FRC01_005529, partial [Tulasnella sp. 417]
ATQASKTDTTTESPIHTSAQPQGLKVVPSSPPATVREKTSISKPRQERSPSNSIATSRPPPRKRTPPPQLFYPELVVSAESGLDIARLAAWCASVPGLPPVVGILKDIHTSVERVSRNKDRCRKLSDKAIRVVFIICDHYDKERADAQELQNAIAQTIQNMLNISTDVKGWGDLSFFKSWHSRQEVDTRIAEHEIKLEGLAKFLSLAATLQSHDKVATLQALLKTTANNSADRKKAEDELYRLRSARPGEAADSTPAELACECVRLSTQPEYSGSRNDIWKGRWLDKQDVALIFYKEYKMGMRDEASIRRFERQIRVWRKLDNPFVLRLYGWCKFEDETYLVSPWLRNRDVVRFLEAKKNRDRICLSLIYEIAQGLQYLHSQEIIHGSLKPSNILVQDDGRACLSNRLFLDFAQAWLGSTYASPNVTVFRYQAPEVILDTPISRASDVYSWAMTALEIITGDPPFHTWKSPGQLAAQVLMKNQVPNRRDYKSPVLDKYPEIWELFKLCWSREPRERPTAKDIVQVLGKLPDLSG